MKETDLPEQTITRLGLAADLSFLRIEIIAYILLGVLLAAAALLGMVGAGRLLIDALSAGGDAPALIIAIDRLLFVLMVVEILHTVRVSFRAGRLAAEPFLIVGLIASIRRVLMITLESSQAYQPGKWSPETREVLRSTMVELLVLGALIAIMVGSIYLLRRSKRTAAP